MIITIYIILQLLKSHYTYFNPPRAWKIKSFYALPHFILTTTLRQRHSPNFTDEKTEA